MSILICLLFWALAGQLHAVSLLFIGAFFWGISDSFLSGTQVIYETLEELGRTDEFNLIFAQSRMYEQIGLACGMALAVGVTYFFSVQVLVWVSILPLTGQLGVVLCYVEPKKIRTTQAESPEHFLQACRLIWQNPKLRLFSLIEIADTSVGMTFHRFEGLYFEKLIPVWAINIVRGMKQLVGVAGFAGAARLRRFPALLLLPFSVFGGGGFWLSWRFWLSIMLPHRL